MLTTQKANSSGQQGEGWGCLPLLCLHEDLSEVLHPGPGLPIQIWCTAATGPAEDYDHDQREVWSTSSMKKSGGRWLQVEPGEEKALGSPHFGLSVKET